VIADLTMASRMSAEAFTTDVARSLRAASIARCAVSSGGFASYRRDPLGEAYREGPGACYNFLYCIKTDRGNPRTRSFRGSVSRPNPSIHTSQPPRTET
jgi:hypothetical protein